MRRLTISALLLSALLLLGLWEGRAVRECAQGFQAQLTQAQSLAEAGDWEAARRLTREVLEEWERREPGLNCFLRHSLVSSVDLGLRELMEFLEWEEAAEYAAANARLVEELHLLGESEGISLENIF